MLKSILVALMVLPSASFAACVGSEALFSCTFKKGQKAVDLCVGDGLVKYAYGPKGGQPELALSLSVTNVDYIPWSGIGRYIGETVIVPNNGYSYEISYSIDRNDPDRPTEGGINVFQGADQIATLTCDTGSIAASDFYPLFQAREAEGLFYCLETGEWGARCGG